MRSARLALCVVALPGRRGAAAGVLDYVYRADPQLDDGGDSRSVLNALSARVAAMDMQVRARPRTQTPTTHTRREQDATVNGV